MRPFIDIHTHHPSDDVISPTMSGIHPWDSDLGLQLPSFVECDIIGETGLDFHCKADRDVQEWLFIQHLNHAARMQKPVVIHCVKALEPTLDILADYPEICGVVFHGFIGSKEQAERCLKRGYYLSFGARSLRSSRVREVIATAPIEQIFCETDDSLEPTIAEVYKEVAALRGCSVEELLCAIEKNYKRLIIRDV